ncbi:hypothetical protein TNCV_1353321 [Trichonephila clavipes]|nr:hypothetical protein TNCV_1353321 [Trichonephila clavipes]
MAQSFLCQKLYALAENIADHHKLFLILFPNRHLTPKMHFALHYPRIIQQLGPPVRFYQVIISMDLVEEKLKEWKLEEYLSNFERTMVLVLVNMLCSYTVTTVASTKSLQEKRAQETKNSPYKFSNVGSFHSVYPSR